MDTTQLFVNAEQEHSLERTNGKGSTVRVWVDGCFDMVHFGHANFLRQAKCLGDYLVVGIHNDVEIAKHKGQRPVFTAEERYKLMKGIKWVDEVVKDAPYVTTVDILDANDCSFCVHGNDLTTTNDGLDTYHLVKQSGRYKEVCRTQGVSTTDIVDRILNLSSNTDDSNLKIHSRLKETSIRSPWTGKNQFFLTTEMLKNFSDGRSPKPEDTLVYVAGAFDLFHVGHLKFLQKAKSHGQYLIVGLYTDHEISSYKGCHYPIMSLQERLMSLLACKYVSEVVIGSPYIVTEELINHFRINVVCQGSISYPTKKDGLDPYKVPKHLGIFRIIDSGSRVTTDEIVCRIITQK